MTLRQSSTDDPNGLTVIQVRDNDELSSESSPEQEQPLLSNGMVVLRDEQEGDASFTYTREAYDAAVERWSNAEVKVWDEAFPGSASAVVRHLVGSFSLLFASSLLLLPWLGPELQQRCRGTPIVQLLGTRLCWFDSTDASWHARLRKEIARLTADNWGEPWGPPLRYESGSWVVAGDALGQ